MKWNKIETNKYENRFEYNVVCSIYVRTLAHMGITMTLRLSVSCCPFIKGNNLKTEIILNSQSFSDLKLKFRFIINFPPKKCSKQERQMTLYLYALYVYVPQYIITYAKSPKTLHKFLFVCCFLSFFGWIEFIFKWNTEWRCFGLECHSKGNNSQTMCVYFVCNNISIKALLAFLFRLQFLFAFFFASPQFQFFYILSNFIAPFHIILSLIHRNSRICCMPELACTFVALFEIYTTSYKCHDDVHFSISSSSSSLIVQRFVPFEWMPVCVSDI